MNGGRVKDNLEPVEDNKVTQERDMPVPERSQPMMAGNSTRSDAFVVLARCQRSTGLILAAAIRMRTSPLPGTGSGTSSYFKTSEPPYSCITTAFICFVPFIRSIGPI